MARVTKKIRCATRQTRGFRVRKESATEAQAASPAMRNSQRAINMGKTAARACRQLGRTPLRLPSCAYQAGATPAPGLVTGAGWKYAGASAASTKLATSNAVVSANNARNNLLFIACPDL